MRYFFISLILLTQGFIAQGQDTANKAAPKGRKISFETKIDIGQATKDGIYLNGYVVNIPYGKLSALNGKTVRIRGRVTIVKGTYHLTDGEVQQGRKEDTKHILKPKIRVITD